MVKEKACKLCNSIYDGEKCPRCGAKESTEAFKGKIIVLKPEKSELAEKLNIKEAGEFAIKTR